MTTPNLADLPVIEHPGPGVICTCPLCCPWKLAMMRPNPDAVLPTITLTYVNNQGYSNDGVNDSSNPPAFTITGPFDSKESK